LEIGKAVTHRWVLADLDLCISVASDPGTTRLSVGRMDSRPLLVSARVRILCSVGIRNFSTAKRARTIRYAGGSHGRGAVASSHDGPGNVVGRAVLVQRLCLISTRG